MKLTWCAVIVLIFTQIVYGEVFFPPGAIWNQDISLAPLDNESAQIVNWLQNNGNWGTGEMRVDFSFMIMRNGATSPRVPVSQVGYYTPDCDNVNNFPLPAGGAIEGQTGYQCNTGANDCHMLVFDSHNNIMWESYLTNLNTQGQLQSTCIVLWNLSTIYPANGRGDQCTSCDAAGFPIGALLFNADEVAAGEINHAIRFILPNNEMRTGTYVHPATHGTRSTSAPDPSPIYGVRLRLNPNYNLSALSPPAQVVAKAMQKYGMVLSDGGNIALTAESDTFTTHKWANLGFTSYSLSILQPTDFQVVDAGARIPLTLNCVRNSFTTAVPPPPVLSSASSLSATMTSPLTTSAAKHCIVLSLFMYILGYLLI